MFNSCKLLSFFQNQDQRTLEIDTAMAMMNLLLHGSWSLLDDFVEFLQVRRYQGKWSKGVCVKLLKLVMPFTCNLS